MPTADRVAPKKWTNISVLFDDGKYSVISGNYDGKRALGERWNGQGDGIGYPSQGGNPLWHVVPEFLALPVLHGLLNETRLSARRDRLKKAERIAREIIQWR